MGLNSQSGAGANANAPPPALALNASSTRGTTEAIIQPVVEAPSPVVAAPAAASVPAPFPQPSPLMASAALVATQAQVQDVGVRRLRSQSMEEEALSVAPPLTRARARSPSIEEIDLTSVLSSPPLSPLLAVSSPAISVVLVHFLPAADPDSEGLRLWRVRVHDARRLHAPRTDGTMRLSAPTTQKGAIFLLRIIPYLRAASRGRRIERPSEPDCSFSIQDLAQFVHPTYRGYSIGAGTGQGPERETIELALETLLQQQDIRLFRQLGDTFTLDISPYASATDWNRRDRAFTFGFLLFILFFVCGSFPTNIHFSLIYAALSRSDGLNLALSPELIARFDSGAAGTLGIWVRLLRSSSSVDQVVAAIHAVNSDDAPVLQLLLDTYGCQQREPVHHLTDRLLTGNLSLSELTGNLFSTYFFGIGQADLLRAQDMMDFCAGFDWALGGGKSPTKLLSQGASTSLSPSTATVSLLDHRIESPADVLKHVKFYTDSEVGSHALYSTELQHRFIRFFLGSGRPDREEFSTLGGLHVEQEYGGGDCARVRRFFHLATGMRQLPPVTTDLRIEVSFHYGQIPPSASGMSAVEASSLQRVYPDFVYKSCSTGVQIWMNDYLRNILKEPVNVADSTQDTLFDCWMYMQVFGGGSSYTIL
ncbi:hypothetical protein PENSPDRAFT_656699 [Peniophora sp. CONT]|nr:hypothetical protein PENSPDRAFT_656699 [Peniophora sp. CONT]